MGYFSISQNYRSVVTTGLVRKLSDFSDIFIECMQKLNWDKQNRKDKASKIQLGETIIPKKKSLIDAYLRLLKCLQKVESQVWLKKNKQEARLKSQQRYINELERIHFFLVQNRNSYVNSAIFEKVTKVLSLYKIKP